MADMKRLVRRAVRTAVLIAIVWSATDEEKSKATKKEKRRPDPQDMERDAAYLTTGLITAARAVNAAHDQGENCTPHHDALVDLLTSIDHPMIAIRTIQHLVDIVSSAVDDEDVQRMVLSIVATELEDDEDIDWPLDDDTDN
jgi:hypothetical protein